MKRRLIIDGQVFQTPAWDRGMGKYSLELIRALTKLNRDINSWDKIEVLLSTQAKSKKDFVDSLANLLGRDIHMTPIDLRLNEYDNRLVAESNRVLLDDYISSIKTDEGVDGIDLLVLSLMQSEIAPVFSSLPYVHNSLLFYDLIPLMLHKIYLTDALNRKVYLTKIAELFKADTYLTISKTVANDLSTYTGIDPSRIHNIDGGAIQHAVEENKPYAVKKPFILMPTGNDLRKNNTRGIKGFDAFNQQAGGKYQLVITSSFEDFEVTELKQLCKDVIFTGNISGEELDYLYQEMDALLFPSEYEGLGLPILEAIEKNKPIACSNISVFREMSKTAFSYFDPQSVSGISESLNDALETKVNIKEYKKIVQKYSWSQTALQSSKAITHHPLPKKNVDRPTLRVFSTEPSLPTTSGKTTLLSHAELGKEFNLEYHFQDTEKYDNSRPRINYIPYALQNGQPSKSAINIYNIDQGETSSMALFNGLAVPGIAVLHSLDLSEAWEDLVRKRLVHQTRLELELKIDELAKSAHSKLATTFVLRQKAIIVYSDRMLKDVQKLLLDLNSKTPVHKLDYPVTGLVYEDTISESRSGILHLPSQFAGITDFDLYVQFNNFQFVSLDTESRTGVYEVFEALAQGLIPFNISPETGVHKSLLSQKPESGLDTSKQSVASIDYIREKHSILGYVQSLKKITTNLEND